MESLSRITPATSQRGRKKQVLDAIRAAADKLSNTPAICRKSYVHDTIVTAFEDGILERFAATMKGQRSQARREQLLRRWWRPRRRRRANAVHLLSCKLRFATLDTSVCRYPCPDRDRGPRLRS